MTGLECLVAAIFFEARDQPPLGQEMVAQVIMNRVLHESFPDSVCGVVYESEQFSFTHDGLSDNPSDYPTYWDRRATESVTELAQGFLMGATTGNTSTHYHSLSVDPGWKNEYRVDGIVGDHIFYTCSVEERNC
jgi:spore germination cell wall hydrolase CwlJ-like protein